MVYPELLTLLQNTVLAFQLNASLGAFPCRLTVVGDLGSLCCCRRGTLL